LDAPLTEGFTSGAEDSIEVLKRAESKFPSAFDADDIGVRKLKFRVNLEFDPFLKIQ